MKTLQRAALLLLIPALILTAFSGCAREKEKVVISCGNVKITEGIYRYWLSTFKNYFVTKYEDIDDTAECWTRELGNGSNKTFGEYVEDYTLQYAKSVVCSLKLFDDYKLTLPKEAEADIDDSLNEIIRYQFGDSKSEFNNALMNTYGITVDVLRTAFIYEAKVDTLESYLFGENGVEAPTDAELSEYYAASYRRIGMIVIDVTAVQDLDEEGKPITDASGKPVTHAPTEEELAAKNELADRLLLQINDGGDVLALASEYGDIDTSKRPNGYYFCADERQELLASKYDKDLMNGIFALEPGEAAKYATSEAIVIIKRLTLPEKGYAASEDAEQFSGLADHVISVKYEKMMKTMWNDILVDDSVYSLKTVDVKRGFI